MQYLPYGWDEFQKRVLPLVHSRNKIDAIQKLGPAQLLGVLNHTCCTKCKSLETFSATCAAHALRGFSDWHRVASVLRNVAFIILHWLFPPNYVTNRTHKDTWRLLFTINWVLGLGDIWHRNKPKHHYRIILRCCPETLQKTILHNDFQNVFWAKYLFNVFDAVWHPEKFGCNHAWVYCAFSTLSTAWYIGKFHTVRKRNRLVQFGGAMRFAEHVFPLVRKAGDQLHRPRYRDWVHRPAHTFCLVPVCQGKCSDIDRFEVYAINTLQPPTQRQMGNTVRYIANRRRPFPRFREHPSIEQEANLNLFRALRKSAAHRQAFYRLAVTFEHLVQFLCEKHGFMRCIIERWMYMPGYEFWLALYIAQPHKKLHYYRIWRNYNPLECVMRVWRLLGNMATLSCSIGRRKLERFLRTTILFPAKHYYVHVYVWCHKIKSAIRKSIRNAVFMLLPRTSKHLVFFLLQHIHVVFHRGLYIDDFLADQASAAKKLDVQECMAVGKAGQNIYQKRTDVHLLPGSHHVPIPDDFCTVQCEI